MALQTEKNYFRINYSGSRGPPQFLKKRSENAGANENLSGGFAAIPGIAPRVAPRIVGFVLIKSWEAIPRMEFRIPRMEFPIPRAAPIAFFLKLGWSPGFWIMHFIADTDTDQNYFGINFRSRCRHSRSLGFWGGGRIADRNRFGIIFYFIADTDTEKYYFRIISAMNSDKRGKCNNFWSTGISAICNKFLKVRMVNLLFPPGIAGKTEGKRGSR